MKFIADMHTHTIASAHAYSTVSENAAAAARAGLLYMGMTDHGHAMEDAPHNWHFGNLKVIPRFIDGVRVIRGIEANIIGYEGKTDFEKFMTDVEWLNVSMHMPMIMPDTTEKHTRSYLMALEDPKTCVLCHTDTPQFPYDTDRVTKECARRNVLIEVNASRFIYPQSVENLKNTILPACIKNGCKIIVNSDAHFSDKIGAFDKAEALLCGISFPQELIVNTDINRFEDFLRDKGIMTNSEL